jgi:hypothetical protein
VGKSSNLLGVDIFLIFCLCQCCKSCLGEATGSANSALGLCGLGIFGGAERVAVEGRKLEFNIWMIDAGNEVSFCFDTSCLSCNTHSDLMGVISMDACFL